MSARQHVAGMLHPLHFLPRVTSILSKTTVSNIGSQDAFGITAFSNNQADLLRHIYVTKVEALLAMLAVAALLWPLIFAHVDRADGLHSPLGASLSLSPSSSSMSTSASAMPSSSRGGKKHGKKNAVTTGSRRSLSAPFLDS